MDSGAQKWLFLEGYPEILEEGVGSQGNELRQLSIVDPVKSPMAEHMQA